MRTPAAVERQGRGRPSAAQLTARLLASREQVANLRLEIRTLRLEGTSFANDVRELARGVQYFGIRDDSPGTHHAGVALEQRADRHLRQRR